MKDLRVTFPNPCDENWDTMTPVGCHRACAKCDKVIYDLSQYDVAEVAALLRDDPGVCVRASIDAFGLVATRPERHGSIRRLVVAVGTSAGLLMAQPVAARDKHITGAIVGQITTFTFKTKVVATNTAGDEFRATVKENGRYRIKNIPAGSYTLTFYPGCGDKWTIPNIHVGDTATVAIEPYPPSNGGCIVVGMLEIERFTGG